MYTQTQGHCSADVADAHTLSKKNYLLYLYIRDTYSSFWLLYFFYLMHTFHVCCEDLWTGTWKTVKISNVALFWYSIQHLTASLLSSAHPSSQPDGYQWEGRRVSAVRFFFLSPRSSIHLTTWTGEYRSNGKSPTQARPVINRTLVRYETFDSISFFKRKWGKNINFLIKYGSKKK